MDILDRLIEHDAWTTRRLLAICDALPGEQLDRRFDIGPGSLRNTFLHIIENVEGWTALMQGQPEREQANLNSADISIATLLLRFDTASAAFASFARTIRATNRYDELWVDILAQPPKKKSFGGTITHVLTHSMHHRAQILYMLDTLGIENIEGDVLDWENATQNQQHHNN